MKEVLQGVYRQVFSNGEEVEAKDLEYKDGEEMHIMLCAKDVRDDRL